MDLALFGIGVVILLVLSVLLVVLKNQQQRTHLLQTEAQRWQTLYRSKQEEASCLNQENCSLREKVGHIPSACAGRCPFRR